MTMPSSVSRARYEGNGTATQFPFSFKVWETSQLAVTLTGPDGKSSDAAGWTASLNDDGGTVTYLHDGSPLPDGWLLAITRNMPFTQEIDLVSATRFDPAVMEDGLDMATAERQQLLEQLSRSVILPPTSDKSPQEMVDRLLEAEKNAVNAAQKAETEAVTATEQAERAEAEADEATRQADNAADAARRAWAWAESPTPPDPDDPDSRSAREWARIASDTVPLATASLPGKACFPAPFTIGENGAVGIREASDRQDGLCRLATAEEVAAATAPDDVALPGSALSLTPRAGKIPVYGAGGKLPAPGMPSLLCNTRLVLTASNAAWVSPVTGWACVTLIGGGGGGCGGGGDQYTACSGGSGGGGERKVVYVRLTEGATYACTIGAGGAGGVSNASGNNTPVAATLGKAGGATKFVAGGVTHTAAGGAGGGSQTVFGFSTPGQGGGSGITKGLWGIRGTFNVGVGGSACTQFASGQINCGYGSGGGGGAGANPAGGKQTDASAGVQGAIIIDYYDPEKENA